tara:strand:+ start:371 stop:664 length:294 start_codon:yes stop_codon:yes gene_type:complete
MGLKLSDVSPVASLIEGEGIMDYAGILPAYLSKRRKDKKADKAASRLAGEEAEKDRLNKVMSGSTAPSSTAMRNGGVTRSRPIDGKAVRGKTRGRKI